MFLSDGTIRRFIESGSLVRGFDAIDKQLQPASFEVRLGTQVTIGGETLDLAPTGRVLHPMDFLLAHTMETVDLPADIVARVEGKSSHGRRGVSVHVTAGFIDPGFRGQIVLEIMHVGYEEFLLVPGMLIAQLSFAFLDQPAVIPYGDPRLGSHYQGQTGAQGAR